MSGYGAEAVGANTRAAIPALREINLRARSVKFRRIENASMRNTHGSTSTSPNRLRPSALCPEEFPQRILIFILRATRLPRNRHLSSQSRLARQSRAS